MQSAYLALASVSSGSVADGLTSSWGGTYASTIRGLVCRLAIALFGLLTSQLVHANEISIVANRGEKVVELRWVGPKKKEQSADLRSGESIPIRLTESSQLGVRRDGQAVWKPFRVSPGSIYVVVDQQTGLELTEIDLPRDRLLAESDQLPKTDKRAPAGPQRAEPKIIPVALFVDDEEPSAMPYWRKKIAPMIAEASQALSICSGVEFRPVAYSTWESDDRASTNQALKSDFAAKASASSDAVVCLGLSRQLTNMPGDKTPTLKADNLLSTHILAPLVTTSSGDIQEEIISRTLASWLGAIPLATPIGSQATSAQQQHTPRPKLRLDPLNAFTVSLVGEHLASGGLAAAEALPEKTRKKIGACRLASVAETDPTVARLLDPLRVALRERPDPVVSVVEQPNTTALSPPNTDTIKPVVANKIADTKDNQTPEFVQQTLPLLDFESSGRVPLFSHSIREPGLSNPDEPGHVYAGSTRWRGFAITAGAALLLFGIAAGVRHIK